MAHATIYMGVTIPQFLRGAGRICPAHSALTVTLKSKRKMDHLERTASNFRQEVSVLFFGMLVTFFVSCEETG
uniref:Uncharacterized protein n=1 Tax=Anser cygnoides TaxID=8845 RepID=A0A8B9ED41_ANSCY